MQTSVIGKTTSWLRLFALGLLVTGLYYSTFSWLIAKDWNREDYTYGWLVPIIVLYLLWDNRPRFQRIASSPSWGGVMLLLLGLMFYWFGELAGEFFTQYFSFSVVLIGLCWMLMGWSKLRTILFALVFTLAMFPPPLFLHNKITFQLKLVSTEIGVWLLHLYGMSAYREGNVIDLGFTQLQVVDACSGLRYLFPLLIMGLLLTYFFKGPLWKKIVIVLSTIPLTIITNSLRIALTGVLFEIWGPVVAEDFFHGFSGLFIFIFGFVLLLVLMWVLSGFGSLTSYFISSGENRSGLTALPAKGISYKRYGILGSPHYIAATVLLASTLAALHLVDFRMKEPLAKSLGKFPAVIEQWDGRPENLEDEIVETLNLSDYAMFNYRNANGRQINFYTAYYQSQTKGASIHSPATCLPGSGWSFNKSGVVRIPTKLGKMSDMPVNRAIMTKGDVRQLSYYWFPQRGRILTNAYQLKLYNFWDAFTRQRTDGALVRLITPVYPNEVIGDADARLVEFTGELTPLLNDFLPQ